VNTATPIEMDLPADEPVINFRRFVKAPPELVYRVFTEPEHLRNWWGPRALEIVRCDVDLTVGGEWHVTHRAPDGSEHRFSGVHRELDPPRRIVRTFVYENAPHEPAVETAEFQEVEGGTMVVASSRMASFADRDMHVTNGMEGGTNESFERLDELVASLQS
jgi:uncharacterized protein YndB with AHSA1/START domain